MKYTCYSCKKEYDLQSITSICSCGGLLGLEPIQEEFEPHDHVGIWGYDSLFPFKDEYISLGEGRTPIVRDVTGNYLKLEFMNPTLSFKDRGSALVMSRLKALGIREAMIDSSGNAAMSMAAYARKAGINLHAFVKEDTSPEKLKMIKAFGAHLHAVSGTRDELTKAALEYHYKTGIPFASHVYDSLFYHGVKTLYYEVYEELGKLPPTMIPVGNGTLLFGFDLAVQEMLRLRLIEKAPDLYIVQPENCSSLKGKEHKETLAEGVALFDPLRKNQLMELQQRYNAKVIRMSEEEIIKAYEDLLEEGIYAEYTSALAYGARKNTGEELLIPITGSGLKNHGEKL